MPLQQRMAAPVCRLHRAARGSSVRQYVYPAIRVVALYRWGFMANLARMYGN